jgi:hypothetical protein
VPRWPRRSRPTSRGSGAVTGRDCMAREKQMVVLLGPWLSGDNVAPHPVSDEVASKWPRLQRGRSRYREAGNMSVDVLLSERHTALRCSVNGTAGWRAVPIRKSCRRRKRCAHDLSGEQW